MLTVRPLLSIVVLLATGLLWVVHMLPAPAAVNDSRTVVAVAAMPQIANDYVGRRAPRRSVSARSGAEHIDPLECCGRDATHPDRGCDAQDCGSCTSCCAIPPEPMHSAMIGLGSAELEFGLARRGRFLAPDDRPPRA